jgi:hypothetical protein
MWYEVEPSVWIAFCDWAVYYPAEVIDEVAALKKRIAEQEGENAAYLAAVVTAHGILDRVIS